MSRVNHRIVRQRLNEKRSKISDSQFFSSAILAGHYEDIAAAQSRRYQYNRRVKVDLYWDPKDGEIAFTDNAVVHINTGNKMITEVRGRENRYQIINGIFGHEFGHVLYTDFLSMQTYHNFLERYHWFPCPPILTKSKDMQNEKDFWAYMKADEKNAKAVIFVAHNLLNILEDGYIESRVLNNFPGMLGSGLAKFRAIHFEKIGTVTQLMESERSGERHILESIMQIILSYAKFGEIKYGDEDFSNERIQLVFGLLSEIDRSVTEEPMKVRLETVNLILIRCWEYIKDFCENVKDSLAQAGQTPSDEELEEALSKILGSLAGSTKQAQGNSAPVRANAGEGGTPNAKNREKTKAEAEKAKGEKPENAGGETEESGEGASQSAENLGGGSGDNEYQEISQGEDGRIPLIKTDDVIDFGEGRLEKNDDYESQEYENAGRDIENLLESMAEKAACEELENERLKELNEVAQNISYGNVHQGINIRVNRMSSVSDGMVERYQAVSSPLLMISRQLQRSIIKQLKDQRKGGKMTGLLMGRKLDARALHRNDGKVFYKNNLPNDIPELAVGLLLDESGSMHSSNRATYARASAIILYDFCQSLDIPVMVYGHSTGHNDNVELYSYAEFDSIDNNDKYRMMDIGARGCNRDGAALRYVAERLSKRPETVKILILVSDGQPNGRGYVGTAAEEDLRGIKQEYQRKGVVFVAAAIGDDKKNIERIYGDSFLDITDLNQLPTKLTAVVKRYIRV